MQYVGIVMNCGGLCTLSTAIQYGQCDFFSTLGIQNCNQRQCRPKIYNLSACITTETTETVNTIETTSTTSTLDNSNKTTSTTSTLNDSNADQLSSTVTALAIIIVILIVLLVIVSVALIWTCWTYKINGATKNQYQQHR